ncbi:MAG: DNA-3-methyladenine glycosylase I [Verrucomicrobia bacterium]|nr:DNA-3-methyladenine glycosylase I [Verrucomicrobiota bacterium]
MGSMERCFGNEPGQEFYADYHDREWGIPVHEDRLLFEMLILEGAQAGLSWATILKRREGYRSAFHGFDPGQVAKMKDSDLEELRHHPGIIRNRLKIYAARKNAEVFLRIQEEFGSFDRYVWSFVGYETKHYSDCRTTSRESDALSKDLKQRGMTFVGSTIMYAYMQAIGMINGHKPFCWRYSLLNKK